MTAVLRARDVVKEFSTGRTVLRGVDIDLLPGALVVVTGARDAGRTTLLRCLAGGYRPTAGRVELTVPGGHVDLAMGDSRILSWARKHHVREVNGGLDAPPGVDAASAAARSAGVERADATVGLHRLGARSIVDTPLGRLRRRDRRTVALAAALLSAPTVLILDEPDLAVPTPPLEDWLDELRAAGTACLVAPSDPQHSFSTHASASAELHEGKITWTAH